MGEYAAKFQPGIDLDEFERRLRAAAPAPRPAQAEKPDPLAELARLVGGEGKSQREDPFEALFRAQSAISDLRKEHDAGREPLHAPHEPYFSNEPSAGQAEYLADHQEQLHFADEPQAFHGAEQDWPQDPAMGVDHAPADQQWAQQQAPQWDEHYEGAPRPAQAAPAGRRKVVYGMAALLLAGVAAIGGTLVMRAKSGPHEIVTIQADSDPARIKPEQADNSSSASSQTLFDRKDDGKVANVVSKGEQPVDLNATVKAARVVGPANNVPTPPAPVASAAPQAQGDAIFPTPKKVKTISVRADGSLVDGSDQKPQAARGLPSMAAMPMPTGGSASPAAPSSAPQPAPKAPVARPQVAKPAPVKPAPVKVAAAKPADKEEIGGETGTYAVQLSGSPVASEARAAANKLGAKYASALNGRLPTFVEAKVGDKTIYRVRVGHLTQSAAQSMCSAIKGQGGSCFVAKN